MTREDIIRMAREAGWTSYDSQDERFERFAALVAQRVLAGSYPEMIAIVAAAEREHGQKWFDAVTAQHKQEILAEREACAMVAEKLTWADNKGVASAIRARGETK